jgi:hypothetical protein
MFKFFKDTIPMQHVEHLGDFFRVCCSLINAFSPPTKMQAESSLLATCMLARANQKNFVQQKEENEGLDKLQKSKWYPMTAEGHLPGFPVLTEEYLRELTFGVYQIKLAKSYVQDKLQRDSDYVIEIMLEEPGFLRARIYSRFTKSAKYHLWIAYFDSSYEQSNEDETSNPITGWYCKCKTGARTLGCCAHIASVLWYLGLARHQKNIKYPSAKLLYAIKDAGDRELRTIVEPRQISTLEPLEGVEFEPDD